MKLIINGVAALLNCETVSGKGKPYITITTDFGERVGVHKSGTTHIKMYMSHTKSDTDIVLSTRRLKCPCVYKPFSCMVHVS